MGKNVKNENGCTEMCNSIHNNKDGGRCIRKIESATLRTPVRKVDKIERKVINTVIRENVILDKDFCICN